MLLRHRLRYPFTAYASAALAATQIGCAVPNHSTQLSAGPEPVEIRMQPGIPRPGQPAEIVIQSSTADSIVLESENGLDRYWATGTELRVWLPSSFGDATGTTRYAERRNGQLLNLLKRPARIRSCREGRCREYLYDIPLQLPERNERSMVVTAGWSSVFARRAITGGNRTVLFREVLNSSIWTIQGDWAGRNWTAALQGFHTADERGGSLDLSRVIKTSDGIQYGVAMHLGLSRSDWFPEQRSPMLTDRTVYQASIGPSIMLRGISASSQLGVYTDGTETLQIMSTRVSANGRLTSVRQPVTITAEKTFAFGGGAIIARRRDARERITAGIDLFDGFAVKVGLSQHRIAWPSQDPSEDLRASETLLTLGGQYSLSW